MRDWLSELDQIDRDCVHQYEYLLGRKLSGYEEYSEIDRQVDEMILDYSSRKDFFEDYPELKKYAKKPSSLDDRIDSAVSRSAGSNSNQLNHLETSSNHEPETLRRS